MVEREGVQNCSLYLGSSHRVGHDWSDLAAAAAAGPLFLAHFHTVHISELYQDGGHSIYYTILVFIHKRFKHSGTFRAHWNQVLFFYFIYSEPGNKSWYDVSTSLITRKLQYFLQYLTLYYIPGFIIPCVNLGFLSAQLAFLEAILPLTRGAISRYVDSA